MGTIVSFRVGQNDVESLARYFQPLFDAEDLLRVPNYNTIVRTLINGVPTQPFSMATLPTLGSPNPKLADALKQLSAAKYGRPRAVVEKEIFGRLETKNAPLQNYGAVTPGANNQTAYGRPSSQSPQIASSPPSVQSQLPGQKGSFLDEWIMKKNGRQPINSVASGQQLQTRWPDSEDNKLATKSDISPSRPSFSQNNVPTATQIYQPPTFSSPISQNSSDELDDKLENISSEALDQQEANHIAKELENNIKDGLTSHDEKETEVGSQAEPAPQDSPKTFGELNLRGADNSPSNSEDTIFIDRDGNLKPIGD